MPARGPRPPARRAPAHLLRVGHRQAGGGDVDGRKQRVEVHKLARLKGGQRRQVYGQQRALHHGAWGQGGRRGRRMQRAAQALETARPAPPRPTPPHPPPRPTPPQPQLPWCCANPQQPCSAGSPNQPRRPVASTVRLAGPQSQAANLPCAAPPRPRCAALRLLTCGVGGVGVAPAQPGGAGEGPVQAVGPRDLYAVQVPPRPRRAGRRQLPHVQPPQLAQVLVRPHHVAAARVALKPNGAAGALVLAAANHKRGALAACGASAAAGSQHSTPGLLPAHASAAATLDAGGAWRRAAGGAWACSPHPALQRRGPTGSRSHICAPPAHPRL